MAAYLRRKTKASTSKYPNELQERRRNLSGSTGTELEADRTRFLQNPAILDTLDSVHRSLLFNNLKFDTDDLPEQSSSNASHSALKKRQPLENEESVESRAAPSSHSKKVNIADAAAVGKSEEPDDTVGGVSLDDELNALFGEDRNNNLNSRVKMMVQQYEQSKTTAVSRPTGSTQQRMELCTESHREVASICDVETSDFESASVTSGSSVSGDGVGRQSARTSSAFSEGSRDVGSIERFDLAMSEAQRHCHQQHPPEDVAGHNTMITININYRCDNNPLRTSKATVTQEEPAGKAVDIVVSGPPQTTDSQALVGVGRKSLKGDSHSKPAAKRDVRHLRAAQPTTETEDEELTELEKRDAKKDGLRKSKCVTMDEKERIENDGSKIKSDRLSREHHRSCQSPEEEEFHDCDDLHESTLSFYEQATSQPVTPQEKKQRSSLPQDSREPTVDDNELDGDIPMIRIVQELTDDEREVTSTITLNKAQIKEMQKMSSERRSVEKAEKKTPSPRASVEKQEKRRKSHGVSNKKRYDRANFQRQQRIIDDNFCNEILDSTIHFDRMYGINRTQQHATAKGAAGAESPNQAMLEECLSDSVVCDAVSPSEESFDSTLSVGKLEGKPRYSGKTVGRLMLKRLKQLQGRTVDQKLSDSSDTSTSGSLLQSSGPKKPPRTFANGTKRSPSCPTKKEVEASAPSALEIGWKLDEGPKTQKVGWTVPVGSAKNQSIPEQVYNMLHYSEDEGHKKLIKVGNSKPAPQQSVSSKMSMKYWPDGKPLGPKLDIDTVDGPMTPRRHSSSTDFDRFVRDSNVKSTPQRRSDLAHRSGFVTRAETRRMIEEFLNEERNHGAEANRKLPGPDRRRRTTGGIFERRRQQQENFLDDARRSNHEPRRKRSPESSGCDVVDDYPVAAKGLSASRNNISGGKVEKRRTFRKAAIVKRTRTLFEASKKKIWALKKFETPKKLNAVSSTHPSGHDPNINRNSSVKKKHNLHHKHLGFTPEHLRCKSCRSDPVEIEQEEVIVPRNFCSVSQRPPSLRTAAHMSDENKENRTEPPPVNNRGSSSRRNGGDEANRKSVRSLNFAAILNGQRKSPSSGEDSRKEKSPRKEDTKFLKTLRNLKNSPIKFFRFATQSTAGENVEDYGASQVGEFHSYDDLNLDNVANMGDFLNNIRRKIDGEAAEPGASKSSPFRQNEMRRSHVFVDVHGEQEDPIYQEISPKNNKTILNEFISKDTNKRYLMVNNNPNILYAMVESKSERSAGRLVKARSLTNVHGLSTISDPMVTSTPVGKPQNNTSKSQVKPTNRRATVSPRNLAFDAEEEKVVKVQVSGVSAQRQYQREEAGTEESESCLFSTALQDNSRRSENGRDIAGGSSGGVRRSFNATETTTASSTRRSLFSDESSFPSRRSDHHQGQPRPHQGPSIDDSDISVLQEEESEVDEVSRAPLVEESLIVPERVEVRFASRKETDRFQRKPPSPSFGRDVGPEDLFAFEKDIIVEEPGMGNTNDHEAVRSGAAQNFTVGKKAHKSVQVRVDGNRVAPLGCFDTDSEMDSLRKYDDREIEELVNSLHDNVTLSDIGTYDTRTTSSPASVENDLESDGHDTVDLAPPVSRTYRQPVARNVTIDTVDVSELISHAAEDSLSNASPVTSSPSSGKMSHSGGKVMRNLKDKLRSSFRKSKSFIKQERQRIANYLQEDRTGSKSSSPASSSAGSPRKKAVPVVRSPVRRRAESDQETDETYRSFTEGSDSLMTTACSMMELSTQHMNDLMHQIVQQGDARKQLKQAVAICRSTREFECSPELIEAERLLLVATQKETAVRQELNKIDYLTNGMMLAEGKRVGTVTLSSFEFPLKETAVRDALYNYFYVVVCTYKHEVKATVAKERHGDGRVYFRDCAIQFHNLEPNYEIRVEVFVLQLRKNVKNYSFESRYHLEKDSKRPLSCPSPSKKLREAGRLLSFRSNMPKSFDFDNEFSRFKSQGFLTVTSFALFTSSGGECDEGSREEKAFDATYATARTSHNTHMSSMLENGQDVEHPLNAVHDPYYSASGHFHPVVCQQEDQSVLLVAEDFKYLTLDSMAYTSNMIGTIGMSFHSEVRFQGADVNGFLDVGEKVDGKEGITWSRLWCKMNGFLLEFWNYPQECQEKQPVLYIDLVKCINEQIELADRTICSRPRTFKVEIFASRAVAAAGASCNSSGIGSFRSTGRTTSPTSVGEPATGSGDDRGLLRPMSPIERGRGRDNVTCYLMAADTQSELKGWLSELNRVVKFVKEWKI